MRPVSRRRFLTLAVFFSGHGVQRNGQNYLLTSDIPFITYKGGQKEATGFQLT